MSTTRTKSYLAIVEREPHGFSAFFPDFPNCFAIGEDMEQLNHNAGHALGRHMRTSQAACGLMIDPTIGMVPHNPWAKGVDRMLICPENA
jgi:predicted RNase H-like HicB family nuclease